jgi:multimeric flavodoxin WrbA
MKVTAFNGSPRKGGNTELMLKKVLEPISAAGIEVELVQVGGKKIHGCTSCWKCLENKNKRCVIDNDILNDCLAKMLDSDAILLGSPSYFSGVTSEMKALIDRIGLVSHVNGMLLARKIGAAVAVHRRGGAVNVFDSINHMFLMNGVIVPGSTYWNFGVGMEQGAVLSDEEALRNMQDLGENIVWLLQKINA